MAIALFCAAIILLLAGGAICLLLGTPVFSLIFFCAAGAAAIAIGAVLLIEYLKLRPNKKDRGRKGDKKS